MDSFVFTLNTVLPVFFLILIGKILYKSNIIDENFISRSSNLVFKLALPALIFQEVSALKLSDINFTNDLIFTFVYCTLVFVLSLVFAMIFIKDRRKVGVFAQGVFRGNYGIVGLALLSNMFGASGLAKGAVILSIATICYNVYATVGFIVPQQKMTFSGIKKILFKIATNHIIIGLVLAFGILFIKKYIPSFEMPAAFRITVKNLASLSLPVALIGIGGAINFNHMKDNKLMITVITVLRTIISPLIFTVIAIILGFRNESLAGLFFLFGVPTAAASFVLARTMDGDGELAANVVASTTIVSVFTISVGVFLLKFFNLI